MSLLGKVLAVLNILAAVVFLLVGTLDWAKRQAWADAVLQHDLLLKGLPVHDEEKDLEGRPLVLDIRKSLRDQIFANFGGDAPTTQVDELEKVRGKLQAKIDNQDAKDTKSQRLARILLPLTKGNDERKKLYDVLADPSIDKSDDLQKRLDAIFDAAKNRGLAVEAQDGTPSVKEPRDPQEWKRSIATVLCRVADVLREDETPQANQDLLDAKAYERAVRVCGLEACTKEMDSWAMQMQQTAAECLIDIDRDRQKFADTSIRRIGQLEEWAVRTNQMKETYAIEQDKVVKLDEVVKKRREDVDKARKDFATAQDLSRSMLKKQAELEQRLLQVRRALRDAFEDNLKLEREIRELEKGR